MRAYRDYLLCDDGRSINVLDSAGEYCRGRYRRAYACLSKRQKRKSFFSKDGKYYYIIEGTGTLAEINFDPDFGTALSYSYSKFDMENPAKALPVLC